MLENEFLDEKIFDINNSDDSDLDVQDLSINDFLIDEANLNDLPELNKFSEFSLITHSLHRLLSGSQAKVAFTLYLFSEFINDAQAQRWTYQDIAGKYRIIKENHRKSILNQLRAAGVLELDYHHNIYLISELGFKIHSLLHMLYDGRDDDSMGILTMQTINSDLLNKDPILALKPLLNKINQTIFNYQDAIRLRSEKLIQEHLKKFSETLEIHELATKAISQIKDKAGDSISRELHYLTQEIGSAQAGLSQYSIKMQRSLAQINRQKVNLSNMGINTFQLKQWLKQKDEKTLAKLLLGVLKKSAKPVFITNQFIDEAHYELFLADRSLEEAEELIVEKDRSDVIDAQSEEMLVCNNLIDDIEKINESAEFIDIIATENWETASYRLSMLSLLHSDEIINSDDTNSEDSMIKFRKLPYKIEKIEKSQNLKTWWDQEDDIYSKKELKNTGLKELSKGLIHRK